MMRNLAAGSWHIGCAGVAVAGPTLVAAGSYGGSFAAPGIRPAFYQEKAYKLSRPPLQYSVLGAFTTTISGRWAANLRSR